MDSDDQNNPFPGRMRHRLNLDSSEEERREKEEREEQEELERIRQQKKRRKEEKKRAREEEERAAHEKAKLEAQRRKEEIKKYNDPAKLFESDSSSGDKFARIHNKINEMFPKFAKKRKQSSSDEQSSSEEESSEESSQSVSSKKEKVKKTKKIEKKMERKIEKKRQRDEDSRQKVKVEHEVSSKDKLAQAVAIRWWYVYPEWPPADFDYEKQLNKRGYRLVRTQDFKFVSEVVNGLTKVIELEGYPGVFKSKVGLIDVRPKESAPTLNFFESKSEEELSRLLKRALKNQLEELMNVEFKQSGESKLIENLKRTLIPMEGIADSLA